MLSIAQKADILRKAGIAQVPPPPAAAEASADDDWERAIDALYAEYTAARAARSLREAEAARQQEMLRRMAWTTATH
ncbi:hypothetical protein [Xenophilus azovorans]|uniref:hypothetical protein n=1 Tax=Xenophilus azovorans TaxID=151755 RepID=UPI00056F8B34|nr:hypothetical protein [Xenophilus azovorans]